jgi:hypothetical protein
VNTQASLEALRDRLAGRQASRFRAFAVAATVGIGVAAVLFRYLREPDG